MLAPKTILLASDLTARCDRPFDRALALAEEWQAKLMLLHVLDAKNAKRDDAEVRAKIQAEIPATPADIEILIARGSVPQTIAKTAAERKSDVIVTGVARYNSLGDLLLGTAVDHIVRNATVPVLIVKRKPLGRYRNLLVATDFSRCSLSALQAAAALFPEAKLHLVHAYHIPYEGWLKSDGTIREEITADEQRQLDEFVGDPSLTDDIRRRLNTRVEYGELGSVIAKQVEETEADLVVLGSHGRSGFSHATIGSNAESLLSWVPRDVLMVCERK